MEANAKTPENIAKYVCKLCYFKCSKESDYKRHILTRKHLRLINANDGLVKKGADKMFACECGKIYKHMSSLCKHKKICKNAENNIENITEETIINNSDNKNDFQLLAELFKMQMNENHELKEVMKEQTKQINEQFKENQKLHQQLIEIAKEGKTTNNNCTNNNTNNFNLQFFLNEQCKDALNIMDFINQLKVQLSDLDMVGRIGYTEGISKIFIRGLKELDVFKRPVHCSDLKREVLYVKDKDAWEKDNDDKNKMKTAIKFIAAKNLKQLNEWKDENPESDDYDSKKHMEYHNIIINATGGSTSEEDDKNFNKIIKNVAKESVIDKEKY
uniref:C2H2-type domain-containing protein n=1 Tax=viral metagenome TaxID=1070528 RepID=A0A6C0D8P2_9ZZZZ